jgi:hypothetical protein
MSGGENSARSGMLELFSQHRVLHFRCVREEEVARLVQAVTSECSSAGNPSTAATRYYSCMVVINVVVVRTVIGDRCKHRPR